MNVKESIGSAFNKAKRALNVTTGVLDETADVLHEKALKARKSKIGRKITYALGGDPDADRVIGYEKHELPKEDSTKALDALNDFLNEQEESK